jgi:hypothetical protein
MKLTKKQLQNLLIEQVLFSEGLRYHVENSIPLYDCIYRPGSKGFFSLISESRKMYNNGFLKVDEDELDMLNSDLGEFALYEGRKVALDFPISEEADYELMNEHFAGSYFSDNLGRRFSVEDVVAYAQQNHDKYYCPNFPVSKIVHDLSYWQGDEQRMMNADTSYPLLVLIEDGVLSVADGLNRLYKAVNVEGKRCLDVYLVPKEEIMHFAEPGRLDEGLFSWLSGGPKLSPEQKREKEYLDFYSIPVTNPKARRDYLKMLFDDPRQQKVWLDYYNQVWKPQHVNKLLKQKIKSQNINQLDERKKRRKRRKKKKSKAKKSGSYYKGRKVKLNKPKRNSGSGGKFVVYVRNQKTGNIKRITFGARGMTTGLRNPARRKSFAARHRCTQKKNKLAPGYWACRIGRYPAVSGAPYTTWW